MCERYSDADEKKRIILLLDGTWNDSDFGTQDTNIVRMREIIARVLWAENDKSAPETDAAPSSDWVTPKTFKDHDYIVFYERGVGTGAFFNRFLGGALGQGLSSNIRRAYKFLSFHYKPGDQIFIFGFSRGAFTARSLVGYIHAAGLLKGEHCTPDLEQKAWAFYRCSPNDRHPGIWYDLTRYMNDREALRIACLGVFDTVGSLGVPFRQFRVFNRDAFEFHSVELCAITDVNLHAMAIDEQRQPFEASPWRKSKFKKFNTVVEQVWFPGAHADVGGGNIDEERRRSEQIAALDDIALDWMLKRVKHHFDDFPINDSGWRKLSEEELMTRALAKQHNSRTFIYRLGWPRALRSLNNVPVPANRVPRLLRPWSEVNVGRQRHEEAIGEMIHVSALTRWQTQAPIGKMPKAYQPKNLRLHLEEREGRFVSTLPLVNWDGSYTKPDREAVKNCE